MSPGQLLRSHVLRRLLSRPLALATPRRGAHSSKTQKKSAKPLEASPRRARPRASVLLPVPTRAPAFDPNPDELLRLLRGLERPPPELPEQVARVPEVAVPSGGEGVSEGSADPLDNEEVASSSTQDGDFSPSSRSERSLASSLAESEDSLSADVPAIEDAASTSSTDTSHDHILQAYLLLRTDHQERLTELSAVNIHNIIHRATLARSSEVLDALLDDLHVLANGDETRLVTLVHMVADCLDSAKLFSSKKAWALFHALGSSRIQLLNPKALEAISSAVCFSFTVSNAPEHLLVAIAEANVAAAPQWRWHDGRTPNPGSMMRIAHMLVALGDIGRGPLIFSSLTALFRASQFPPSVVRDVDFTPSDPRMIVISLFAKALVHWHAVDWAVRLFVTHYPRVATSSFGLDLLRDALAIRPNAAAQVLIALLSKPAEERLSEELILQYYDAAEQQGLWESAEAVYDASQLATHPGGKYPHPRGAALPWLLGKMVYRSKNERLTRMLARHIVDADERIPIHNRGSLVASCARAGLGTEARALYERYAAADDPKVVTGHAAAAVRLISLFSFLANRKSAKYDQLTSDPPNANPPSPASPAEEVVLNEDDIPAKPLTGRAARRHTVKILDTGEQLKEENDQSVPYPPNAEPSPPASADEDVVVVKDALPAKPLTGRAARRPKGQVKDVELPPHLVDSEQLEAESLERQQESLEQQQESILDMRRFIERVFEAFVAAKEPIRHAAHQDLTSYSRMAFMIGRVVEGSQALQYLLDRKELPDIYDVNVALASMAAHSPREAATLLRRMRRSGMHPDGVSFSSVLQPAFEREDWALVRWLIEYARWLEYGELSLQALGSLVRASVTDRSLDAAARHRNLRRALHIVTTLSDGAFLATPTLGEVCVRAALEIQRPATAYEFWRALIKGKVENDREQRGIRVRIAIQIRRLRHRGHILKQPALEMLEDLGEDEEVSAREGADTKVAAERVA